MDDQEARLRRVGIIGTLVVLGVGALLLAASVLPSFAARSAVLETAPQETARALPRRAGTGAAVLPTAPRLPTITVPTPAASPGRVVPPLSPDGSAGATALHPTPAISEDAIGAHLMPILIKHLACIAPGARHDVALDPQAAALAQQDDTPPPTQGAIQVVERAGQRILLGADMVADLRDSSGRCGETLIFGVPPLDWLRSGTRFGLGVAGRTDGIVIVIVTQ
jgi:hypothetical protein